MNAIALRKLQRMTAGQISDAINRDGKITISSPAIPFVIDVVFRDRNEGLIESRALEIAGEHIVAYEEDMDRRIGKIVGTTLAEVLQGIGHMSNLVSNATPLPVSPLEASPAPATQEITQKPAAPAIAEEIAPESIEPVTNADVADPVPAEEIRKVPAPDFLLNALGDDDDEPAKAAIVARDVPTPGTGLADEGQMVPSGRKVPAPSILLDALGSDEDGYIPRRPITPEDLRMPPPPRARTPRSKIMEEYAALVKEGKSSEEASRIIEERYPGHS